VVRLALILIASALIAGVISEILADIRHRARWRQRQKVNP